MSDVFAPPAEGSRFGPPTRADGPWHGDDGQVLALADSAWPERCLRCGSNAELAWVDIVGRSAGDGMALLAFGSLGVLVNRRTVHLRVPVCERHRAARSQRVRAWAWSIVVSLLVGGASSLLFESPLPGLGGLAVALFLGFLVSPGVLGIDRLRGRLAYVNGVSAAVRDQLPSAAECDVELLHLGS